MPNLDFRILVVDDNPDIHHDFIKILSYSSTSNLDDLSHKMFGNEKQALPLPHFKIDTASQGQEGVERIQSAVNEKSPYSLAFVDIRMPPGWDGIETIKHIWEIDKDVQVVICTAYSDYSWEETVAHLGQTDNLLILKKPFDIVSVRQLACALTKKWQLLQDTRKFTSSLQQQVENRTVSLKKSLSLVKATLESSSEGIVVISNENKIIDYNKKFCDMWDIPAAVMETRDKDTLKNYMESQLVDPEQFRNWLEHKPQTNDTVKTQIIHFKNGNVFDCYAQPQLLNNEIVGSVLNFNDITERMRLQDELHYQAKHDALTGLANRVMLFEEMQKKIKAAEQNKTKLAVMFLDLDRFKLINDSLSHAAGDALLQTTAGRLTKFINDDDILARLGGDEFVICLTNLPSSDAIKQRAKELVDVFREPIQVLDRTITVTSSIGVSIYPDDALSTDILLRDADAAMYNVKEIGGNTFKFYADEMNLQSIQKLDQEMELRNALANNEFFLTYQPQMDLNTNELLAVEALLRWQHPKKGLLLPIDFIAVAEETGLIIPIGEWVLRTACIQNKKWQDAGLPPIRIGVNVTALQLKQQNFVQMLSDILQETKLNPDYLEVELTENIVISSVGVIKTVNAIKELGVRIAVDDFGTGYSSLSYLKNLPLDRLKIDGSFIQNVQSENDDEVILRAIISIAKNLNLEVIAEGVETQNQIEFLKKQKCNEIQGYYFSEPLSELQVEKLLKRNTNKTTEK